MVEDHKHEESLLEKIAEKIHGHGDSSSSHDSDDDKKSTSSSSSSSFKSKIYRLFGREKPVHKVLGGGKPADIFLWRNKKVSGGVFGAVTACWIVFELIEYHFLTFLCHFAILALAALFLWSNACTFIHKASPHIPEVHIPEDPVLQLASGLRIETNRALTVLRNIASGKDIKKFILVIAGLWILSIIGSCCNFLTLFYTATVLLFTIPVIYEKYEDKIDAYGEKAMKEIKKQYAVLDEKVLSKIMSKIPRGSLNKKMD
ncbi:hypothetical protein AALP_AA6G316900 [Arabis alpina]|uniref:Reticulon-like protein n=1 Tax=Arabis alpina TaxID=50452 RepID=A0A087GSZ8_ARAAL|nr:hypothetical protein AALP_AA6G316900 [Arabis alpina]